MFFFPRNFAETTTGFDKSLPAGNDVFDQAVGSPSYGLRLFISEFSQVATSQGQAPTLASNADLTEDSPENVDDVDWGNHPPYRPSFLRTVLCL